MKKSKFLDQILRLTLAIALVVSIVPTISTKAASSGWIKVTSENKTTMDENLSDILRHLRLLIMRRVRNVT